MVRNFMSLFVLCGALISSSCIDLKHSNPLDPKYDPTDSANGNNDLIPLKIGNYWQYKYYEIDTTSGDTLSSKKTTWEIYKTITIENYDFYLFERFSTITIENVKYSFFENDIIAGKTSDGLLFGAYQDGEEYNIIDNPRLFKYPISAGTSYLYVDWNNHTLNINVTAETISVPAGKFYCYRYRVNEPPYSGEQFFYFSPGTGLVKVSSSGPDFGKRVFELISIGN